MNISGKHLCSVGGSRHIDTAGDRQQGEFAFTGLEINFMEISPPQIFKIIPMEIKLRGMMLGR